MSSSSLSSMMKTPGAHIPEDKIQYLIQTPYGRGLTIRTRKHEHNGKLRSSREIELLDWNSTKDESQNQGQGATRRRNAVLYSHDYSFPSIEPKVGDQVMTPFGRGNVQEIRSTYGGVVVVVVVLLTQWRLSGRNRVLGYFQPKEIKVVRSKRLYEMDVYEKVEYATDLKTQANQAFSKQKDYQRALELYAQAIEAVKYVQHNSSSNNTVRADLLQLLITCYNNAGTCCMQLNVNTHNQKLLAIQYAQNALVLIQALRQGQTRSPRILNILRHDHHLSNVKLFGQFVVKSNLIKSKALLAMDELDEAMACLKQAHEIIQFYSSTNDITNNHICDDNNNATTDDIDEHQLQLERQLLQHHDKEVKLIMLKVKERKRAQLQKEKMRAQAMFGAAPAPANGTKTSDYTTDDKNKQNGRGKEKKNGESAKVDPNGGAPSIPPPPPPTSSMNGNGNHHHSKTTAAPSRRVSFNENIQKYEIPHKDDDKQAAADQAASEQAWYQDADFLIGLTVFASAAILAAAATAYAITGGGRGAGSMGSSGGRHHGK